MLNFPLNFAYFFHILTLLILLARQECSIIELHEPLSCSFDEGSFCNWRTESNMWDIRQSLFLESFQFILKPNSQNGSFAFARRKFLSPSRSQLISPELPATSQFSQFHFWYWKITNSPSADICLLKPNNELVCIQTISGRGSQHWKKQVVRIPPRDYRFQIVIRVRDINTANDVLAIDDIFYNEEISDKNSIAKFKNRNLLVKQVAVPEIDSQLKDHSEAATTLPSMFGQMETTDFGWIPVPTVLRTNNDQDLRGKCHAVACSFNQTYCSWKHGARWILSDGNVTMNLVGEDKMISDAFMVPSGAVLELHMKMSNAVQLVITEIVPSAELVAWSHYGSFGFERMQRLHVALQSFNSPTQVQLKAKVPSNNFITVSNIRLVSRAGDEIECETNSRRREHLKKLMIPTKYKYSDPERLVAFQKLPTKVNQPFSLLSSFERKIAKDKLGAVNYLANLGQQKQRLKAIEFEPESSAKSEEIRTKHISADNLQMHQAFAKNGVIDIVTASPSFQLSKATKRIEPFNIVQNQLKFISMKGGAGLNDSLPTRLADLSKSLKIDDQAVMTYQLRRLAKQLGLNQIFNQQGLYILKQLVSENGSFLHDENGLLQNFSKIQPIVPVNAPVKMEVSAFAKLLQRGISSLATNGISHESINNSILKKIASILPSPRTHPDFQSPLTRQNLDFIVQNANLG